MKKQMLRGGAVFIFSGFLVMISVFPIYAQGASAQIIVRVDGLSCPFCAYGLEKKIKRLEGTTGLIIDMERGVVEIKVAEGKTIPEKDLKKAILDAGFTPGEITYGPGQ